MVTTPIAPNLLTYTDTSVTNGTQYFYTISAQNVAGSGPASNVEQATPTAAPAQTKPPMVTNLHATVSGSSAVATWTNNGSVATNNETDGQDYFVDGTKVGTAGYPNPAPTTYTFTGLSAGTHTLGVGPYNGAGVQTATTVPVTITNPPPSAIPIGFYAGSLSSAESSSATCGISPLQGFSAYTTGSNIPSWSTPTLPGGCLLLLAVNGCQDGTNLAWTPNNLGQYATVAHNVPNNTIIRPFWEWDGNWFAWGRGVGGNTTAQFITAWQDVVNTMRGVNATLKFDWCGNAGSSNLSQLQAAYPGDAYVDYIGADHYDNADGGGDWSQMGASVNMASLHNKPVSCGEWGLKGNPGPGGGYDDPNFITLAHEFFYSPAAASSRYGWPSYTVAYHSYFNAYPSGGFDSVITDGNAPNSLNTYKSLFG